MRPDGIAFRLPNETKAGVFCILEFKRMSDVTDQYLLRARFRAENQYESLRRALGITLHRQVRKVEQISFIAGARSLNEQDLRKTLKFFQVPEPSIESIGSKLAMRIFDENGIFSNACIVLDSMGAQPGPALPQTHNRPRMPTPPPSLVP